VTHGYYNIETMLEAVLSRGGALLDSGNYLPED